MAELLIPFGFGLVMGAAIYSAGFVLGQRAERARWMSWARPKARPVPSEGPFPGAVYLGARDD